MLRHQGVSPREIRVVPAAGLAGAPDGGADVGRADMGGRAVSG